MRFNEKKGTILKILIAGAIGFLLVISIFPRIKDIYELAERKKQLELRQAELQKINNKLQQELERVTSPAGVEKIAREQLGMVKDGEILVLPVTKEE